MINCFRKTLFLYCLLCFSCSKDIHKSEESRGITLLKEKFQDEYENINFTSKKIIHLKELHKDLPDQSFTYMTIGSGSYHMEIEDNFFYVKEVGDKIVFYDLLDDSLSEQEFSYVPDQQKGDQVFYTPLSLGDIEISKMLRDAKRLADKFIACKNDCLAYGVIAFLGGGANPLSGLAGLATIYVCVRACRRDLERDL